MSTIHKWFRPHNRNFQRNVECRAKESSSRSLFCLNTIPLLNLYHDGKFTVTFANACVELCASSEYVQKRDENYYLIIVWLKKGQTEYIYSWMTCYNASNSDSWKILWCSANPNPCYHLWSKRLFSESFSSDFLSKFSNECANWNTQLCTDNNFTKINF